MAIARPQNAGEPLLRAYPVIASHTVRQGMPVKITNSSGVDYIEEGEATTDLCLGVSYKNLPSGGEAEWPAGAGDIVSVAVFGSPAIVPMRVGTADAVTQNNLVVFDTAGCTNATLTATGAAVAVVQCYGLAVESSTADGELVGINIGQSCVLIRPAS